MAINFQDHWDRATTNSKHYFANYGATIAAGSQVSSSVKLEEAITHGAPIDQNYLGVVAKVQNSFLSERLVELKPATRPLTGEGVEEGATEEVGHYLKDANGAMLEKPFIAVMNWSDKIGTLLANATFKLTPTKAIGNLALISAIPAAALRAAALLVGVAICAGIIAPLEFLAVLAVKSKEGLQYVGRKIAQTAPFILTGLAAAGAIAWKGIQITGQAIAKGAVLAAIGVQKTAKALAYLIAHIAVIATVSVIDLLQFTFKAIGWVWSTITGVRQLSEDNAETQRMLAMALDMPVKEKPSNAAASFVVGYINRCAKHGYEGSINNYALSLTGRATDETAAITEKKPRAERAESLESLSSVEEEEAVDAALNPFAQGATIAVKRRNPLERGGVDPSIEETFPADEALARTLPKAPTAGKPARMDRKALRSLGGFNTFALRNPIHAARTGASNAKAASDE